MTMNLVNLCLDAIVDHFRRFILASTLTEDESTKLKLMFLQKKYSFDLLERLYSKEDLPEEFVDFLINKYLKVFDSRWLRNCSREKFVSKILEIGCSVEKVFLQGDYLEEFPDETPLQDVMRYLPNLKSFSFPNGCDDITLDSVAMFCPEIEEIDIENSPITLKAVKFLCKSENGEAHCTKLKKLCIKGTPINDDDIAKYLLKNLPSLEVFDYPDLPRVLYSLHKKDSFLHETKTYNITSLNLMSLVGTPSYVDALEVCLHACPRLKNFSCGLVNEDYQHFFSNLSELEQLHIENLSDSEINIDNLLKSKGRKLTSLTIECCVVSASVISKNCPHLKDLILDGVHFLFDHDDDLRLAFNSLSSLTLENYGVSESERTINLFLSSSPKLESLSFLTCDLMSYEIKADILRYCELCPLKKLSFSSSVIEKEYVEDIIFYCRTLKYLNIDGCFGIVDGNEILKFAENLASEAEIDVGEHSDTSDLESSDFDISDYSGIGKCFYIVGNYIGKD